MYLSKLSFINWDVFFLLFWGKILCRIVLVLLETFGRILQWNYFGLKVSFCEFSKYEFSSPKSYGIIKITVSYWVNCGSLYFLMNWCIWPELSTLYVESSSEFYLLSFVMSAGSVEVSSVWVLILENYVIFPPYFLSVLFKVCRSYWPF